MTDFVPFALPDISRAEIDEVVETLRSGWITSGPKVVRFEQALGDFLGYGVHCVAVNSATAGLHLALEACGVGAGDEVIVPVHTFTATAEVVCYLNARPIFVDVEEETLNIDVEQVERAMTNRTKAIIPVHYAGLACNLETLIDLAQKANIRIVEDAAHALPTSYQGRLIGTLDTDATVFSFYANKTITTGEGGMLVTRVPEIAKRARMMRLHGIDRDVFARYQRSTAGWYCQVVAPGYKYNLTDIAASLGIQQLTRAYSMRDRRAEIAARYDAELAGLPLRLPSHSAAGDLHAWHLYVVRLTDDAPIERDSFLEATREAGIGCSVHYVPLHLHPFWKNTYGLRPQDFPVSTDAFRRIVSLPLYSRMSDADVDRVIEVIRTVCTRRQKRSSPCG